ncbi:CHAP domain-containing protein [Aminicella lysinilytica]|mgnify:CR=1 FL=1|uniref:CHAP domain-containing protein n=1 Tax=Aminicella lysinilytica TaxID=433323 RepID=UPI0026F12CAC|nr:CHAP domain-containing protein [Aminicella lysinilytica]
MMQKRKYKISKKRLAADIVCLVAVLALIAFGVNRVFFADKGETAASVSVAKELTTAVDTTAEHEKLLAKAIKASPMVRKAVPNIGYKGGKKFWTYCGYSGHIDWCACFASWCGGQNGYIDDGKMEEFVYVPYGVNWFKEKKKWKDVGYKPTSGSLIFFDWDEDGTANHVGIVEYYHDGIVYTIEGNRDDTCIEGHYSLNSKKILGYGIINE